MNSLLTSYSALASSSVCMYSRLHQCRCSVSFISVFPRKQRRARESVWQRVGKRQIKREREGGGGRKRERERKERKKERQIVFERERRERECVCVCEWGWCICILCRVSVYMHARLMHYTPVGCICVICMYIFMCIYVYSYLCMTRAA